MNKRKVPSFTIVSVAAGLVLLLSPGLSAQANSATPIAQPTQLVGRSGAPDISEGELDDIAILSESLNISMAEGLRLYGPQEDFLIALAETEIAEKGNFSAAGYETSGSARGWISFVSPPKASTVRSLSSLPMQVELRSGSAFSAEAADAALTRVVERISLSGATDRFNAWVEPVSGNLKVEFKATNLAADGLTGASISKVIGSLWGNLPYSVEANHYFHGTAPAVAHGGDWISSLGCTAGFTVLKGGVPGISTAGHCGDAVFTYGGYVAGFQQRIWGSGGDAQWSSFAGQSSSAILNTIRLSSSASTTYRYITGTANPVAGAGVCY